MIMKGRGGGLSSSPYKSKSEGEGGGERHIAAALRRLLASLSRNTDLDTN